MMNSYNMDDSNALKARKAIILARVSSKEQEEGYSIDAQKHRLETYCLRRNLNVVRTFEITESSTMGDRRKFMAMIKFVRAQREPVAIVADKVDRVQRSFKEYPLLDELIQKGKIELHFNTENYVIHKDSVSQERLMWSMGVIMAQSYIDSMRDNVKRSFGQKIRMGEWIAKAPLGYMNVKDERGKSDIILDPDNAPLVKKLFEEYATGAFTLSEMVEKARNWGLRNKYGKKSHPQKALLHRVFNNPFYYGQMLIKGQLYQHRYEPLISKALFDQCQAVLEGWHKKPFQWAGKEFVFRGLITCATTGRLVTGSEQKKTYKSGKTASWTYLRCWKPDNPDKKMWVREERILAQVEAVLKGLQVEPDLLAFLQGYLRQTEQSERGFVRRQVGEWQREHTKLQNRLDTLMDLLLDGTIERAEFEDKKAKIRTDQIGLEDNIAGARAGDDSFKDSMLTMLSLASEAYDLFKTSNTALRRELVNRVFANLKLDGGKLRYTLREPFDRMFNLTDRHGWQGQQDLNPRPTVLETVALPTELYP